MRRLSWMAAVIVNCTLTGAAALGADPDPSTPAGAQRLVRQAEEKGDQAALRKFLHATTPIEQKLADAFAENAVAGAAAYKAAVAKFGEQETRKSLQGIVVIHPTEADDAKTPWKIEGNKATPISTGKNQFAGPALNKIDGVWKLRMSDITDGQSEAQINQMISALQKLARVMRAYTAETEAGKYATAGDFRKAALERINAVGEELKEATTQATTTPAK